MKLISTFFPVRMIIDEAIGEIAIPAESMSFITILIVGSSKTKAAARTRVGGQS